MWSLELQTATMDWTSRHLAAETRRKQQHV